MYVNNEREVVGDTAVEFKCKSVRREEKCERKKFIVLREERKIALSVFSVYTGCFLSLSHDNKLYNVQTLNIEINKKRKAEFYERSTFLLINLLSPLSLARSTLVSRLLLYIVCALLILPAASFIHL